MAEILFNVDVREFQKALREYNDLSRHDSFQVVNKVAKDVAYLSASNTPKSSPRKIQSQLLKKTGGSTRLIYKIVNKNQKKIGGKPLYGEVMGRVARSFIQARQRSVGFLRSGWADIIIDMGGSYRGRKSGGRARLGKGIRARATINPTATLFYYIPAKQFSKSGNKMMAIAQTALSRAIAAKTQDLKNEIERRLAQRARQLSAA